MPWKPCSCNNKTTIVRNELEAGPVLSCRERLTDHEVVLKELVGMCDEGFLVDGAHKVLKPLLHPIVVPAIVGCPT